MPTTLKRPTDPEHLRVIIDLLKGGYSRAEIGRILRISQATYYRRLEEIARLSERPVEDEDADRDDDD